MDNLENIGAARDNIECLEGIEGLVDIYSFGHTRTVATLFDRKDYIELEIDNDYGNEALKYLEKYKDSLSISSYNLDTATLKIDDTSVKEDLILDLTDMTSIKCWVTIGDNGNVHIEFSQTPYKKCVNALRSRGLCSNKRRTKWFIFGGAGQTGFGEAARAGEKIDVQDLIDTLKRFKYLKVIIESKEDKEWL